jgi:lipopolysaccharide export system permease protein
VKQLDRLVLKELIGPWMFGVAIFTSLIMAGTYLFKLTEYIVNGINIGTILELTFLLLPGVMVKTFPMAVLLATLLGFGRLSGDSEIVAVRAAGASLGRIMLPVGIFGLAVALISLFINELVVPQAAYRGVELTEGIEKNIRGGGDFISRAVYDPTDKRLLATMMARDFNIDKRTLQDAFVVAYDKDLKPIAMLYAKGLSFRSNDDWEIEGGGRLWSFDLTTIVELDKTWPKSVPKPPSVEDIVASRIRDLDSFSFAQMQERIKIAKGNPSFDMKQILNLEYGLHNKIALPFAALIFGLVGAPFGIKNHRTGAASGFWVSVLIIFAYMMLTRFMSLWALGGKIPPWAASYAPLFIGLVVAVIAIRQKNV